MSALNSPQQRAELRIRFRAAITDILETANALVFIGKTIYDEKVGCAKRWDGVAWQYTTNRFIFCGSFSEAQVWCNAFGIPFHKVKSYFARDERSLHGINVRYEYYIVRFPSHERNPRKDDIEHAIHGLKACKMKEWTWGE